METRAARIGLRLATGFTLVFLYLPLGVIALYAFNQKRIQTWPISGLTVSWWTKAFHNTGVREAVLRSVEAALGATAIALLLGTLAALAVTRYRFFGRETISFLVILPIALPGIVTGMALNATFCIVVMYNNVLARLRRASGSIEEASMDLGADTWQTFRYITLPLTRTALLAGGLLAFALSFDEVIVTTFTAGPVQTVPLWILQNLSRPNQLPIVNVVAVSLVLLSAIPVYIASRLAQESGILRRR